MPYSAENDYSEGLCYRLGLMSLIALEQLPFIHKNFENESVWPVQLFGDIYVNGDCIREGHPVRFKWALCVNIMEAHLTRTGIVFKEQRY